MKSPPSRKAIFSVYAMVIMGLILPALSLSIIGCKRAKGGKVDEPIIPVVLEEAFKKDISEEVRLAGEVQADVEVKVYSLVPERILKLTFEEGDFVKKGDLLAMIKAGPLYDAVRQSKAGLAAAKTQEKLAKIELDRTRQLYSTRTVAIAALQRAEAQYDAAKAQVTQMKAVLGGSYSNISRITIRAPISGVIGQRFLSKGDMAGQQIPLCTIIQTEKVRIKAMATEFDLVKLRKKQKVSVTVPALKDRKWYGNVDYISPVLDRATRSAWVTILVENHDRMLRPGMFADVVVEVGVRPNVVLVKSRSLIRWTEADGKVTYSVYLVKENKAMKKDVSIGIRKGDYLEITKGIDPGEYVVSFGSHKLKEGSKVKVIKQIQGGKEEVEPKSAGSDGKALDPSKDARKAKEVESEKEKKGSDSEMKSRSDHVPSMASPSDSRKPGARSEPPRPNIPRTRGT